MQPQSPVPRRGSDGASREWSSCGNLLARGKRQGTGWVARGREQTCLKQLFCPRLKLPVSSLGVGGETYAW